MTAQAVIPTNDVIAAIEVLLAQRIHPVFAGYLCLRREALRVDRTTDLDPDFVEFHDTFLRLPGGPPGKPYYRPFWDEQSSSHKAWYQSNVAGTYAPSSAKRINAFTSVISVHDSRYSLKVGHVELAFEHMLYRRSIPGIALARFLYRDFALSTTGSIDSTVLKVFRFEFGYEQDEDFSRHFDRSWPSPQKTISDVSASE